MAASGDEIEDDEYEALAYQQVVFPLLHIFILSDSWFECMFISLSVWKLLFITQSAVFVKRQVSCSTEPQDLCFSKGSVHVHKLNDRKANRWISVFVINLSTTLWLGKQFHTAPYTIHYITWTTFVLFVMYPPPIPVEDQWNSSGVRDKSSGILQG